MYQCDCQTPAYRRIIAQLGATCLECKVSDPMVAAAMDAPRRTKRTPRRLTARGLGDAKRARDFSGASAVGRPVS